MKQYVVGFLFTPDNHVVLIRKTKPEWQAGFLNGVGGKIEPGETPKKAMIREFHEETGLRVTSWQKCLIMQGPDYKLYFYQARSGHVDPKVESRTEEVVGIYPASEIQNLATIANLGWIVPFLLHYEKGGYKPVTIKAIW